MDPLNKSYNIIIFPYFNLLHYFRAFVFNMRKIASTKCKFDRLHEQTAKNNDFGKFETSLDKSVG